MLMRMWSQRNTSFWWECKPAQPLWKSSWQFFRKLGIVLLWDPAIPLLSLYWKGAPLYHRTTCLTTFIATLFIIVRNYKQPRYSSAVEWTKKMWYIYVMKYYLPIKNWHNENFRQMNEWGNPDTERHTWHIVTYKWTLVIKYRIIML